ncbi:MAG: zinc ribbon domain-containing protein [Actinomycetota bacterium]
MTERPCPVCAEPADTRARFCSACGVDLEAPVLVDPVAETIGPEPEDEHRGLTKLFVPLGVAAAIGLAVLFLVSGGDDGDDPDGDAAEGLVEAPTATPLPTPTATPFRVTLPESTPPQPTPTRTPSAPQSLGVAAADLTALPPTDATHLAVAHDRDLAYLDLETGTWILHERVNLSSVPNRNTLRPFADGVLSNGSDTVLYVPVDGRPVTIAHGLLLGTRGDVAYVQTFEPSGQPQVRGFDATGGFVEQIDLPALTNSQGMLSSGELVVDGGGKVFLVGGTATTVLADAQLLGVSGNRVLIHTCDAALACGFELVDVATGTRSPVTAFEDTTGFPQLVAGDRIVVYDFPNEDIDVYRIEGTDVVLDEEVSLQEANFIAAGFGEPVVTDTTGLYARVEGDRLLFHGPTGDAITEVDLDFLPGFGDSYSLAFVTADG